MAASGARRSILLLVSSMSAGGRSVRLGPRIVRILRGGGWEVAVRLTTPGDDPVAIAGEVASGSFVAALGGDGYLGAVARGCHESDAIFVPMPGGRGNDLCRALRIGTDPLVRARSLAPLGFSSNEAGADSSDWLASRIRPLDGMWVRSRDGVRLALGIVSIGLDARANILANESSFTSGPLAYGYGAFAALASHEPTEIVATVDGVERNMSGWIASASNSGRFGGGITLSGVLGASGASKEIGQMIANGFGGSSPFVIITVVAAFIIFLTEFTSNTASAALLVPVFASVAAQTGMPKEVLVLVIGIGASCAFMLPVATPPNALVFGTGEVRQRDMFRAGLVLNLVSIAVVALFAYYVIL